jgi:hypothetical protein
MQTLRTLAAPWSQADVSRITGISDASLSRHWDDEEWLHRVKGDMLSTLIAGVPGVGTFVISNAVSERRSKVMAAARDCGLGVDQEIYDLAVTIRPEPVVMSAVETAVAVVTADIRRSTHLLSTLWNLEDDRALAMAFAPPDRDEVLPPGRGLFENLAPLIDAAHQLRDDLVRRSNSHQAMLALSVISHHLGRVSTLEPLARNGSQAHNRHLALAYRSEVMGRIVERNDIDLVGRYEGELAHDRTLSQVERWALPAGMRDVPTDQTLYIPERCSLPGTASEIVRHIELFDDAYLAYIIRIALPHVLAHDPTFGQRLELLRHALSDKIDRVSDAATRRAAESLLRHLPAGASHV